jgi:hypothetical protein
MQISNTIRWLFVKKIKWKDYKNVAYKTDTYKIGYKTSIVKPIDINIHVDLIAYRDSIMHIYEILQSENVFTHSVL